MSLNYEVKKQEKIVIFGHKGLIGSALLSELKFRGYKNFNCYLEKIKFIEFR